ncbi:SDR family oxidoreductase [Roseibacterium sp. SDUM158016]|jgi:NAD(P)-dependent dehydrogenase (short-subunit alcohol dehydrogenase family)|uniref:SDR family oxidoreductase n=1 Tax=Roseicyclus sediminis TaxID=2980997 RepID=UPI0021D3D28D|nr:SDR family oxidoreductase [Roseibacterium sp. SDUM158016]MCU4653715.1 SDR family oxidoreductase [Roseibacterium sp. SDUM158016]
MSLTVDFKGKTVVVVGGTSGINRGIAELFARHGARVAVASRKEAKVTDTVAALEGHGAEAMGFVADVRDLDAVEAGLKSVHEAWGDFDVLVSGAAGNFPASLNGMSANAFRSVVEIDLIGTVHVMKASYPYLKKPGASVVNISAPQAFLPMPGQSHVSAAKAGVDMITRTLAIEWGRDGIRVNSVVPGPIGGTEGMARLAPTPDAIEKVAASVPLNRLGTPDDIGHACMYLSSDMGAYVSGAVLPVDGGWAQSGCGGMGAFLGKLVAQLEGR